MVTNLTWYNWNSSTLAVSYEVLNNVTDLNESSTTEEPVDPHQGSGEPYTLAESIIIGTILSLFIFVAVFGNVLVCVAVFKDRRLRHRTYAFIVSLAIADLLVALLVMTFAVVNDILNKWLFGPVFCNIWISSDINCSTASILNLCAISLDRYIHIKDPYKYKTFMTKKMMVIMISTVWILSLTLSFLPIHLQWHRNAEDRYKPLPENLCVMDLNPVYSVVSSTISFYLPCIIMIIIYVKLYCAARSHVKEIRKTSFHMPNGGKGGGSGSKDHKAAVTLGIIMGVFLLCWMPFFVVNLVEAFCKCVPILMFKILTWLGYVNSCLNPIIYSIFNKEFRNAFRKILFPDSCKCVRPKRNGYAQSSRTTSKSLISKSEYIMHSVENGNRRDCKEPLCAEGTPL